MIQTIRDRSVFSLKFALQIEAVMIVDMLDIHKTKLRGNQKNRTFAKPKELLIRVTYYIELYYF